MTKPVAAPEIFQIPLDQIDPAIVPPGTKPGTPEFEEAVIMHYVLRYAEKDRSAQLIKLAAEHTQADFVFTVMEAWGMPRDKMPRYQEIYDKYGSVGASPYKIDTASFVVETRYGVWGAQAPLRPKGYSKKKRTFGPVALQFMDGVEGRFVGLLPEAEKQNLH